MADEKSHPSEARAALFEFQRYLSDQVAPLMVADSMATLLRYPPDLVVTEIHSWISAQYRGEGVEIPLSDYLFHAVKKIHLLGEFHLLVEQRLKEYLEGVKQRVLDLCPPEDREMLRKNFEMLGQLPSSLAIPVETIHRQAGSESKLATALRATGDVSVRRVATLISRLDRAGEAGGQALAMPERRQILSHTLTTVANKARNESELEKSLETVQHLGVETDPAKSFRLLSESLPTWAVPISTIPPSDEWPDTAAPDPILAMRRIISIADDPAEAARRFRNMVEAAIERLNEGSLGRAATMLELADRLISEKLVEEGSAKSVKRSAHELIDQTKLRAYSETKDAHFLLKKVLNFFTPLTAEGLLDEIEQEHRRDRRRAILALLEVHGDDAWKAALERLRGFDATGKLEKDQIFFVRNLLYVLNRIPPPFGVDVDKEVDQMAAFTAPKFPALVLKESIGALAHTRHDRAERILIRRLAELEPMAIKPSGTAYSPNEARQILDRIVLALGRFNTSSSLRSAIEHGLKTQDQLGDTAGRLSFLSSRDLSSDPDLLQLIIGAIRNDLPKKVLGFVAQKNSPRATKLIEALGGTPAPEVYELLEEIRSRFPGLDFGRAADAVLQAFGSAKAAGEAASAAPSLVGDLEVFGLPALLQSLGGWQATGVLTIYDSEGKTVATASFDEGKIARCQAGLLHGKEAIFQLFEEARPGTFAFIARKDIATDGETRLEIEPVIFEAVRRFDALREARLLVPETVPLAATGTKPTPHPAETDAQLVREVWLRASSGEKPNEWKWKLPADSYRIWRLLAHWYDTGALQTKAS